MRSDPSKRKRLGQYFTGTRLAKLLASLALSEEAVSIIDPMNGCGDMIGACLRLGTKARHIVGVEIDPAAHLEAARRFAETADPVELFLGDAFCLETIKRLPATTYDLVITNPPYVRYQRQNKSDAEGLAVDDAKTIRQRLLTIAEFLPSLAPNDRQLFRDLIMRYSGLSDLAVPAWLLCAMLTEIGGTLAMVVPATWLSRNYASIVHYLLLRCFEIRYVIEDESAAWFKDALVKTTLLVAKRVKQRPSAFQWTDEGYIQAFIPSDVATEQSMVGELFPESAAPEKEFATILLGRFKRRKNLSVSPISISWVPMMRKAENLSRTGGINKWLDGLENAPGPFSRLPSETDPEENVFLHPALSSWLGGSAPRFASLASFGVKVGQGLRTGANQFFYTDIVKSGPDFSVTSPHSVFGSEVLTVPTECLLPVLRRQSELPETFQINPQDLKGRVLALQKYVLPEDSNPSPMFGELTVSFKTMPDGLATFVREVAKKNLGTEADPRYVPEFSAVRTNIRPFDSAKPFHSKRHWYMLPDFAPRHRPDLFLARINYMRPKTFLNAKVRVLIDANFSTLWLTNDAQIGPHALLAVLNSTWCVTSMELQGTVMGGGALKLEAAHLRRLPIPSFSGEQLAELEKLGCGLPGSSNARNILSKIDELVINAIQSQATHILSLDELGRIGDEQLARRVQKR